MGLFARWGAWWVQPLVDQPFTPIQPDSKWRNSTHFGTQYAALLIEAMNDLGGELTLMSQVQDGQLLFSVSDTGVGLPTERVDQIFSAFFTTKPQGDGLGLAISRSIVESHSGRLWATGNGGQGAVFHFTLPTEVTQSSPLSSKPFSIFKHETKYNISYGGS